MAAFAVQVDPLLWHVSAATAAPTQNLSSAHASQLEVTVFFLKPAAHVCAVVAVAHVAAFAVHGEEPQVPVACTKKRLGAHAMQPPVLFHSW